MKDIVKSELIFTQKSYLKLLKKIKNNIETNWEAVIDEINLFWFQKKKFITFIMENYFTPYNTFVFTAATFLDYDDKEHFPFISCCGFGIIDDIICSYGNMIGKINDDKFNIAIKNQLMVGIEDDIKLLENCSKFFCILPIRFLLTNENESVAIGAENAFLSLFNEPFKNMKDYFQRVLTYEDLEKYLNHECEKHIMLHKDDNIKLPLRARISKYMENASAGLDFNNKPMSYIFMTAVYAHIAQALDVILLCTKYKMIPYLRYNVAFTYFIHLMQNKDIAERTGL